MTDTSERKNITRVGLSMLLMIAVTVALQYAAAYLLSDAATVENRFWLRYVITSLPQYLFAMPLAWLVMKSIPAATPEKKKLSPAQLLIILFVCYAIIYAGNLISTAVSDLISRFMKHQMANVVEEMLKGSDLLPNLIFAGILAPIAEELFFRKTLIDRLSRYGDRPAIAISGLIFGLAHGNLSQFFYAYGLGAALGYVYVRTGKIGYTIALHMFINLMGGVLGVYILENAQSLLTIYSIAVLAMAITGGAVLIKNIKRLRFERGIQELDSWKHAFFLNEGMALFFIACAAIFVLNTIYAVY